MTEIDGQTFLCVVGLSTVREVQPLNAIHNYVMSMILLKSICSNDKIIYYN